VRLHLSVQGTVDTKFSGGDSLEPAHSWVGSLERTISHSRFRAITAASPLYHAYYHSVISEDLISIQVVRYQVHSALLNSKAGAEGRVFRYVIPGGSHLIRVTNESVRMHKEIAPSGILEPACT
jgi:hypothetical protein